MQIKKKIKKEKSAILTIFILLLIEEALYNKNNIIVNNKVNSIKGQINNKKILKNNINIKRIPILVYHKFANDYKEKKIHSSLIISKSKFRQQMLWLKENGIKTLNCNEFYDWYTGKKKLIQKSVLITFDDGNFGVVRIALPVLMELNLKATSFIIGNNSLMNKKGYINYRIIKKMKKYYPNLEFQSHSFDLHFKFKEANKTNEYQITLKDAKIQKKFYNFTFHAYPFGYFSEEIIKAYKESGIKMAFAYGKNGYANKSQDIYKIRRIKINGKRPFSQFLKWFKH